MIRSHIVISGTGRAGTTFLVQLLTHLGLNTGFDTDKMEVHPIARAGLELDIRDENAPYIVKSPSLCDSLEDVLASSVRIEHAIIPVREFEAAAASRAHVQKLTTGNADGKDEVNGGLWGTDEAYNQVSVLRFKFTKLIEVLVRHDIPMTFLAYPQFFNDPDYLYEKLTFLLGNIDLASFRTAFDRIVRPEWIHQFNEDDRFDQSAFHTPENIAVGCGQLTEEARKRQEKHRSGHERDEAIAWLRVQANERENLIRERDEAIAWLKAKAAKKANIIRDRDEAIAWLKAKAEKKANIIRDRDEAIAWLKAKTDETANMIRDRDEAITWLKARADQMESLIRDRDETSAVLQDELAAQREVSR